MKKLLSRFWTDDKGVITVEAVIVFPFVALIFCATYVFCDAYRVSAASQKAAYIVADAISRQTDAITPIYIFGMSILHDTLTRSRSPSTMRVSSIGYDDKTERYKVLWSVNTGSSGTALTETEANDDLAQRLPQLTQGETVVLVESAVAYQPLFRVGLGERTFRQVIATRPRFSTQVAFSNDS